LEANFIISVLTSKRQPFTGVKRCFCVIFEKPWQSHNRKLVVSEAEPSQIVNRKLKIENRKFAGVSCLK